MLLVQSFGYLMTLEAHSYVGTFFFLFVLLYYFLPSFPNVLFETLYRSQFLMHKSHSSPKVVQQDTRNGANNKRNEKRNTFISATV
jgi:hypothetical protein